MSYETGVGIIAILFGAWAVLGRKAEVRAAMAKKRRWRLPMSAEQQERWVAVVGFLFIGRGVAVLSVSLV